VPKIAMWGAPGSGKTTFLAALDIALKRGRYGFNMAGMTDASVDLLIEMTDRLIVKREFPPNTQAIDYFEWDLFRNQQQVADTFGNPISSGPSRITLTLADPSGELARPERRSDPDRKKLIDDLADSDGILFMFDPIREFELGDAFSTTNGLLHQITAAVASRDRDKFDGTLPQHVAICVTKFDEPKVLATAKKLGILRQDPHDQHQLPRVHEHEALKLLTALTSVSGSGDGEMLLNALHQAFPGRVKFFVTSAVGFYINPMTNRFDEDDPQNLVKSSPGLSKPGESRIRGALRPINVVEPILWLSEQIAHRA
jgi:energy-coupling factor transporter ATP-binding protein EcfA2